MSGVKRAEQKPGRNFSVTMLGLDTNLLVAYLGAYEKFLSEPGKNHRTA